MKICWFGTYNQDYPRNYVLFEGLAELGIGVVQCNIDSREPFWYFKLAKKFRSLENDFDVVYAGFPSQLAVLVAKFLTRKPVVMDAMSSLYDGVVYAREQRHKYHPIAIKFLLLDWLSAILADRLITDTEQHKQYWASWFMISEKKIDVVPLGSSTKHFYPLKELHPGESKDVLLVQYHGSYIKVQGLDVVIEAVKLFKNDPSIQFRFIGSGEEYAAVRAELETCCKEKVTFIGRIPFTEMNKYLNEADVILGLFGNAKRADRAVANKVYEGLAVGKAVINKDTPAIHEEIKSTEVVVVERDAHAIAAAITRLKDEQLRHCIAQAGHRAFRERFSEEKVSERLILALSKIGK